MNYTVDRFNGCKILKPGLKLIGAKTKIRDLLYRYFQPADLYVEPFLGTGGVLVGLPEHLGYKQKIVGDLNTYLINYYNVIQTRSGEFWEVFKSTYDGFDEERFHTIKREVTNPLINDVQRAVDFYLITKHCMNGIWRLNKKGECNSSFGKELKGRGIFDRLWLDQVILSIQNTAFQNTDCQVSLFQANLIAGNTSVFAYLDPPYHDCLTTYNGIGFNDANFRHLLIQLKAARYKWLLSINDDEFIRDLFKDYDIVKHNVFYSCSQTAAGRTARPELFIANYPIKEISEGLQLLIDEKKTSKRKSKTLEGVDSAPC